MAKPPAIELWVFAHEDQAGNAGFRGGRHRQDPNLRCWTVRSGDADALKALNLSRVVITEYASRYVSGHASRKEAEEFQQALEIMRHRLRVAPCIWMEL